MTRDAFLTALRTHLRGMPAKQADEIIADYASHFDEGMAAGRNEADIAAALGDPARLARELKAEQGLKRWEEERSASAAAGAVLAILSLGAIDLLILLPVLLVVLSLLFAFACVAAALVVVGVVLIVVTPFALLGGGFIQTFLAGLGMLSMGLATGALIMLGSMGLTNMLISYGRLHMRLIKPIAEPGAAQ